MKKLKLTLLLTLAFAIFALPLQAQRDLEANQFEGYVLNKKGKKEEGIIMIASVNNPWENQRMVRWMSKKDFNKKKKIKKKDWEKYKSKDIKGYSYNERVFKTKKHTQAGTMEAQQTGKLNGLASLAGNLSKNKHFMEELVDGKVKVYRFFNYPPEVGVYSGNDYDNLLEDARSNPELLVQTGKGKKKDKLTMVQNINWKKTLAACPAVLTKFENDEYAIKSKGLKGFFTKHNDGLAMEKATKEIFEEFNACAK